VLTAANLNTHLRDNLTETAVAKVTTQGDLAYATGANALARLAKGTAGQGLRMNAGATAPEWGDRGVENETQEFVERGTHKLFAHLGSPPGRLITPTPALADGDFLGAGFQVVKSGAPSAITAISSAGATHGYWQFSTSASATQDIGVTGLHTAAARDWTMVGRIIIPSVASQEIFLGFKPSLNFADENGIIAFRVNGTGNLIGVSDSGGTETTRDTSATGATEQSLRIEVRSGGTIVRFYKNGTQVGADVTTNIPTGVGYLVCGIRHGAAADKIFQLAELAAWTEA
jgi:hypothetical protein